MPRKAKRITKRKSDNQPSPSSKLFPSKKVKGCIAQLHAHLPTNCSFWAKLEFPNKQEGMLRVSTWNVCGINAFEKKGPKCYLIAEDPDIMILGETKMQAKPEIGHIKHQFQYQYWGGDNRKVYAGVAILSKHKPLEVIYGLPTVKDQASTNRPKLNFTHQQDVLQLIDFFFARYDHLGILHILLNWHFYAQRWQQP
ncbi:hypothetical protein PTTG_06032 [Puccinia triticina 1-1 BBBD Race 1]|uniref:Endonuclease/exonuclease/phosphatase domain-containing protein n=1 Tax=Puccinia triticina (isolate 1-1 / race 1 (BBBD)) TaxID=630390 RepID=A0A180G8X9_PUCT1|nr:hypothetical protein PTTG_06032 [Puccinia triticina 1-1 BBBD Race 1]WAR52233.1 hypothetical protein PtB15_1B674 [Puccinia triticina]